MTINVDNRFLDRVARGILSAWTENPQSNDAEQIVEACIAYALDEYAAARDEIGEAGGMAAVRDRMILILRDEWNVGNDGGD